MAGSPPADARDPDSDAVHDRAADHASIDRLTAELLPALIAKLGATGLGELEVREGGWRVRLRRPAGAATASVSRERRPGERGSGERAERGAPGDRQAERTARAGHGQGDGKNPRSDSRGLATSPAVGIYRSRPDLTAGARVRAGDRLGAVDMLGVAQEVIAPVDGIVGASLVESGDAVEYGQGIVAIEFSPVQPSTNGHGA